MSSFYCRKEQGFMKCGIQCDSCNALGIKVSYETLNDREVVQNILNRGAGYSAPKFKQQAMHGPTCNIGHYFKTMLENLSGIYDHSEIITYGENHSLCTIVIHYKDDK